VSFQRSVVDARSRLGFHSIPGSPLLWVYGIRYFTNYVPCEIYREKLCRDAMAVMKFPWVHGGLTQTVQCSAELCGAYFLIYVLNSCHRTARVFTAKLFPPPLRIIRCSPILASAWNYLVRATLDALSRYFCTWIHEQVQNPILPVNKNEWSSLFVTWTTMQNQFPSSKSSADKMMILPRTKWLN
jgi:hypothetical protein